MAWITLVLLGLLLNVSPAAAQSGAASQTVDEVNRYRANLGLSTLQMDPALMAAAQGQADYMARNNVYSSHQGEGGTMPADRAAAAGYPVGYIYENVVGGGGMTPAEAVAWWHQSPIHQNTLRLPDAVHIGVGYATDDGHAHYVLVIGRPRAVPTPRPGETAAPTDTPGPVVIPVVQSAPEADGSVIHTVQQGQTLWDIGAVYGVTLDDLRYMNNLQVGAVVHPGDLIIVRLAEGQAPPPTPTPQLEHIVQEGQTLWDIAAIHGLTLDELLTLNGMQRGVVVFPGDKILLRTPDPTATITPVPTATFTPSPEPPTSTPTDIPPPTVSPTATLRPTTTLIPTTTLDKAVVAVVAAVSPAPTLTALPTDPPTATATVTASATATAVPAARATVRRKSDNAVLLTAIMLIAGLGALMIGGSAAMIFRRKVA